MAGKTVTEIRKDLTKQLSQYFDSPEVTVDVIAYNSKVFYVITQGAGLGDNVRRVPITGNETVLDALSMVNGLSQVSSTTVWIARPAPGGFGCQQILPVDYEAIAKGGSAATNYQVMPGDRVFIAEDNVVCVQQLPGEGDGADRAAAGHQWAGHFHRPQHADHGPQLQFDPQWHLTQQPYVA